MRYNDALSFINSLELFGIKMGLDNTRRFLQHLGNPQMGYRTIHVAGTNGKGSVASMLYAVLSAAGYRTGVFTSPHLVDYRERVRTQKGTIDKRAIATFIAENQQFIRDARITFFELSTALALWHFRRMNVEVAVVEVGLGGRLDATNILEPDLSIITHIDYDHTKILGNTLEKIAAEKAGIIKSGGTLITGERRPNLLRLFRSTCRERKARLIRSAPLREMIAFNNGMMRFELPSNGSKPQSYTLALVGTHQARNAAIVLTAVDALREMGYTIPARAIRHGLKNVRWAARFQTVCRKPIIILDVAHNLDGTCALVDTFRRVHPARKAVLVCGFLERPDHDQILKEYAKIARRAVLTKPDYHRAAEIEGVIWSAVNAGVDFDVKLSVAEAVRRGLQIAGKGDIVLICGSHFTVGEAITELQRLHRKRRLSLINADITLMDA